LQINKFSSIRNREEEGGALKMEVPRLLLCLVLSVAPPAASRDADSLANAIGEKRRPATSPAEEAPATKEDETVARLGRWVLSNWASAWSIQRFDISEPNRSDRSCPHDLHPTVQMTPDPDGK